MSETDAWVATSVHSSHTVYHTRRDCQRLESANETRPVTDREIAQKDLCECETCVGDHPHGVHADFTIECPHCGTEVIKLGLHVPCPNVGGDDE